MNPIIGAVHLLFICTYNCGHPDMPAFALKKRFRRAADAPRIETGEWARTMSRRIEASVARDYSFGCVSWKYMSRSSLNLSQSLYAYERNNGKATGAQFTARDFENGAVAIAQALWGVSIRT